jgi:ubiquinone/menaquinone biosynthesis C-methylase UbiE
MPSRSFAALYDLLMHRCEPAGVRRARGPLIADLSGDVLEVGCGTGGNFDQYPPTAHVTAIDYSPHMIRRAKRKAREAARDIVIEEASAEALPFPDGHFDHTFATLVLCSVGDPEAGLAEMRRVTKPSGSVRLLEHVRSDRPRMGRLQDWVTPLWRTMNDGCHLNRDTVGAVERSGLIVESVEDVPGTPGFVPMKVIRARVPED